METNYVTISCCPFGRYEIIRRLLDDYEKPASCQWCGSPARFEYGNHQDGIYTKPHFDGIAFCSIGCRNTYHE